MQGKPLPSCTTSPALYQTFQSTGNSGENTANFQTALLDGVSDGVGGSVGETYSRV